jgi:hypothetical protein
LPTKLVAALEINLNAFELSAFNSFRRWGIPFDILPEYEVAAVEIINAIRDYITSSTPGIDKDVMVITETVTPTSVALT